MLTHRYATIWLIISAMALSGKDPPEWIAGRVVSVEERASWQQHSSGSALFSGPVAPVKALIYRIETDAGTVDVAQRAGSVFAGFPKPLLAAGDAVRITAPRDGFWTGSTVTVEIRGKAKKLYFDSQRQK